MNHSSRVTEGAGCLAVTDAQPDKSDFCATQAPMPQGIVDARGGGSL